MTVVATAGHVDHGKTSLVRALTGIDTDRLAEEKRRGLTIDLGFAHTDDISFVDVPGHVRFLRNMLAGVGGIDACLLVVDAREGWMPQTEEHYEILRMLNVSRGVIAITKCDLVDDATAAAVELLVRHRVEGDALADATIVRTRLDQPASIEYLRDALRAIPPRSADSETRARLWIDRVFAAQGAGTVVTGTLLASSLTRGDEVELVPQGRQVRIRAIQSRGIETETGFAGSRVALNLAGIGHSEIERGHQLVHPGEWWLADAFDCEIRVLPALRHSLNRRGNFLLYVGTEELPVTIRLIGTQEIAPGATGLARIFLPRPLALAPNDRFVLRETGRDETVAGGMVMEVDPSTRMSKAAPTSDASHLIDRHGMITTKELFLRTGLSIEPTVDDVLFSAAVLTATRDELLTLLQIAGERGVVLATLDDALRHVAKTLRPEIAVVENGRLFEPDKAPSQKSHSPVLRALEDSPFSPPDAASLNRDELQRLVQAGRVVNLGGIYFAASSLDAAHDVARTLLEAQSDGFIASEFREALGTTRKFAIPLAEALDARGITRRRGDRRIAGPRL